MKEVLQKCAESLAVQNFRVENVHSLTKDQDPWSRSWKVSVPAQFKELMSNPAMYPKGWSHRPFTKGPRRQERGPVLEDPRSGVPGAPRSRTGVPEAKGSGPGVPKAQRSGPGVPVAQRSVPGVPEAQRSGSEVLEAGSGPRAQEAGLASV